jgi:CRISPR/Cas system CSM-associated protein Csm2 small subunit
MGEVRNEDLLFAIRAGHYERAMAELNALKWCYFVQSGRIPESEKIEGIIKLLDSTIDEIGLHH